MLLGNLNKVKTKNSSALRWYTTKYHLGVYYPEICMIHTTVGYTFVKILTSMVLIIKYYIWLWCKCQLYQSGTWCQSVKIPPVAWAPHSIKCPAKLQSSIPQLNVSLTKTKFAKYAIKDVIKSQTANMYFVVKLTCLMPSGQNHWLPN